jgi:hypothetical protein
MLEARAASGAITLGRRRRGEMLNSMNMGPPFFPTEADHPEDSGDAVFDLPAAPAYAPAAETWATRLLREGISALTETFHRAPRAAVEAKPRAAVAGDNGGPSDKALKTAAKLEAVAKRTIAEALDGADAFVGVSVKDGITVELATAHLKFRRGEVTAPDMQIGKIRCVRTDDARLHQDATVYQLARCHGLNERRENPV